MSPRVAPDRWLVVETPKPADDELAGVLVDALLTQTGHGVEERDGALIAFLPSPPDPPDSVIRHLRERIEVATGAPAPPFTFRWQAHEAWEETWKRGFTARRITSRLVVSPTWEVPTLREGELLITLDPGMAFGTAEHPTTRGALRLLDPRVSPGDQVADVGAGSGILAIAAALRGAARVIAIESDPWSCVAARENTALNGVSDRVDVRERLMGPAFLADEGPFDGIVSNIDTRVIVDLLKAFRDGVREGGWLVLSGILSHEADEVVEWAGTCGFALEGTEPEGEWWSGAFRRGVLPRSGTRKDRQGHAGPA